MSTCLYPRRDETTACGYAHSETTTGATLQCGQCGAVAHAPASPDGRVPIQPLVGWTVIPDQHVVRCPACATGEGE